MSHFLPLAVTLALCACSPGQGGSSGQKNAPPPSRRILLGAYVPGYDYAAFEARLGRKLDIINSTTDWTWLADFPAKLRAISASGHIAMVSWAPRTDRPMRNCVLLSDISAGKYDPQIAQDAAAIKAVGATVWVRWGLEMTNSWPEKCANPLRDPAVYKAAWAHIQAVFDHGGATNVKWVYAPGEVAYATGDWLTFMPSRFDLLGVDHYNKTTEPEPFSSAVCSAGPKTGKPFIVSETGADPADQAEWLGNVKAACPGLMAFVYWDGPRRAISSPAVFAEFRKIGE